MKVKAIIIILFLSIFLIISKVDAQDLNITLSLESTGYSTEEVQKTFPNNNFVSQENKFKYNPFPTSIYLGVGINFTKSFTSFLKYGYIIADDYYGSEVGFYPEYEFYKGVKFSAHYIIHFNKNTGGNSSGSKMNTIHLLGLGISKKIFHFLSIEGTYLIPIVADDEIGWSRSYNYNREEVYRRIYLNNVFKIGLKFNWNLTKL